MIMANRGFAGPVNAIPGMPLQGAGPYCVPLPWALPTAKMELRFQRDTAKTSP